MEGMPDVPEVRARGTAIRDYLVDFFGGLVPGLLFTFAALFALSWPTWASLRALQQATPRSTELLDQVREFAQAFNLELLGLSLVAAYVEGHVFFRQDP